MVLQELTKFPRVEKTLWYQGILAAPEGTGPGREVVSCPPRPICPQWCGAPVDSALDSRGGCPLGPSFRVDRDLQTFEGATLGSVFLSPHPEALKL